MTWLPAQHGSSSGIDGSAPVLDRALQSMLHRVLRAIRWSVTIDGLAVLLLWMVLGSYVQLLIDYMGRMSWSVRAVMLAVLLGGILWIFMRRLFQPLQMPLKMADAAHLLERTRPELRGLLISAVEFSTVQPAGGKASFELMQSVVDDANRQLQRLSITGIISNKHWQRSMLIIVLAISAAVSGVLASPATASLWFRRNILLTNDPWWQRTHLIPAWEGEVIHIARGDDLDIRATIEGVIPRQVEVVYTDYEGHRARETMVFVGDRGIRHSFANCRHEMEFYLVGGDGRTETFFVKLTDRPQVVETSLVVEPPAYTGQAPVTLGDGQRSVKVLPGTKVTIDIVTSKPCAEAILMAGEESVAHGVGQGAEWQFAVQPDATRTYHVMLLDEVGLENKNPPRFSVRLVKDEPPTVRLTVAGAGELLTPQAILPLQIEASDTYGVARLDLMISIKADETMELVENIPEIVDSPLAFSTTMQWSLEPLAMLSGSRLSMLLQGQDFDDVLGPNVAKSSERSFRIVTRDELLAELFRRELSLREDIQRLLDQQEQLRGRLLTAMRDRMDRPSSESTLSVLTNLERQQRGLLSSLQMIRRQFEQIESERVINGLDTVDEMLRLRNDILQPILSLTDREMPLASEEIKGASRQLDGAMAAQMDVRQEKILRTLRGVLSVMLQWEGFQEILSMLQDIVRLQQELNDETKQEMDRLGEGLFDD